MILSLPVDEFSKVKSTNGIAKYTEDERRPKTRERAERDTFGSIRVEIRIE